MTVFYIFSIVFPAVVCFLYSDTNSLVFPSNYAKSTVYYSGLTWKFAHSLDVRETLAGEGSAGKSLLKFRILELLYVQHEQRQSKKLLPRTDFSCLHVTSRNSTNIYLWFPNDQQLVHGFYKTLPRLVVSYK